ncbi:Metallo-dependent hydrolase [Saccharata proteae CBS 121410]|uniref:Metallo-dependent hydrolase n=1 Tax=Saccharata proteae CBS 121410 TaxID=1314787 RepID=A0A9P4LVY5_9PEZI|nr:Metallo-dependent hydrolase [Saccharata proteae CBS 121410]
MPVDRAFAQRLPKIELHAHLSGSISRDCLHHIWEQKTRLDPAVGLEDPLVAIPPGKVDYNLETFFPLFSSYIYKLCSDLPSIKYSTNAVLDAFRADNVVHLELRTTPRAIPHHGITKTAYVKTILDCIREHNEQPGNPMRSSLILSIDRRNTLVEAEQVVSLAISLKDEGVVGVDLCGNPATGNIVMFSGAFARAKAAGLNITVHFAEAKASSTDEELWTLLAWQPDRLGHVIHVNDEIRGEIVKQNIGVELCISCNVHAKMILGTFKDHHFGWWRGTGVGVALSTDDVGVFCSPLSEEYYIAAEHFKLEPMDVRRLCEGVVKIIFADGAEKERLSAIYSEWDGWALV